MFWYDTLMIMYYSNDYIGNLLNERDYSIMKKALIASIISIALIAESIGVCAAQNTSFSAYQSDDGFSDEESLMTEMFDFGEETLGDFSFTGSIIGVEDYKDTVAFMVNTDAPIVFSYNSILDMVSDTVADTSWRITSSGRKKVAEDIVWDSDIKNGAIMVQKSADGENWNTEYMKTDVFAEYKESIDKFYTARRADLYNGCFYRVIVAYATEKRLNSSKFLWVFDNSDYETRWNVEEYKFYILANDYDIVAYNDVLGSVDADSLDLSGTVIIGNQTTVNRVAGEQVFHSTGGTGFAAEAANIQAAVESGQNATHVGGNNVLNGADYIITNPDGSIIQIQCKYYSKASETIRAAFDTETGFYRYYADIDVPMQLEVPADQYDDAILLMRTKISNGLVPGVTDPEEATNIVRKGKVTYQQAVNIAKAGTVESLVYDAKNSCVASLTSLGISAAVEFAVSVWNDEDIDVALKKSLYTGLEIGGTTFITSVLAGQLSRAGLNSLLVPSSEAIIRAIGPKAAAVIVNAGRIGMTPIYGAAAMKSAAKLLRGNVIVGTISLVIFTVPDIVNIFRGRISGAQLIKNTATTVAGIGGGFAGAAGGAAIGSAIFPGVGTVIGGIVGAIGAGVGASAGADALGDIIAEDDADVMLDVITFEFQNLAEEYMINNNEAEQVSEMLSNELTAGILKDMYASKDHNAFARKLIIPFIEDVISEREKIVIPDEEKIAEEMVNVLEEIYDAQQEGE